jgi:hypothetical protein
VDLLYIRFLRHPQEDNDNKQEQVNVSSYSGHSQPLTSITPKAGILMKSAVSADGYLKVVRSRGVQSVSLRLCTA